MIEVKAVEKRDRRKDILEEANTTPCTENWVDENGWNNSITSILNHRKSHIGYTMKKDGESYSIMVDITWTDFMIPRSPIKLQIVAMCDDDIQTSSIERYISKIYPSSSVRAELVKLSNLFQDRKTILFSQINDFIDTTSYQNFILEIVKRLGTKGDIIL